MNNDAQIFILCEDTNHYHFARKYFELLGFNKRKIYSRHNPKRISVGSGAKYVENNYLQQIKAFKSKANHLDCILIVIIDDDTKNLIQNLYQLYTPSANEKILIFSPKRNIESWFHYIEGNLIDETEDYKKNYRDAKPTEFAKKLKNKICINDLAKDTPSSLHHACKELEKL
ncbi:MAG: hypothetical protein GQ569_01675 [Methylococcaceae bacterium]|nr:hypothetical protein [Methylococcaceae bacterium]